MQHSPSGRVGSAWASGEPSVGLWGFAPEGAEVECTPCLRSLEPSVGLWAFAPEGAKAGCTPCLRTVSWLIEGGRATSWLPDRHSWRSEVRPPRLSGSFLSTLPCSHSPCAPPQRQISSGLASPYHEMNQTAGNVRARAEKRPNWLGASDRLRLSSHYYGNMDQGASCGLARGHACAAPAPALRSLYKCVNLNTTKSNLHALHSNAQVWRLS